MSSKANLSIRFIEDSPLPFRKSFLRKDSEEDELRRQKRLATEPVNCTWTIQVKLVEEIVTSFIMT